MIYEFKTASKEGTEVGDATVSQFHGFHRWIAPPIFSERPANVIAHVDFNLRWISVLKIGRCQYEFNDRFYLDAGPKHPLRNTYNNLA